MPFSVSGHAAGSVTAGTGDVSSSFQTETSATITVIYHYIPNLPSLDPPPASPTPSAGTGTVAATISSTGTVAGASGVSPASVQPASVISHVGKHGTSRTRHAAIHRHGPTRWFELARHRPAQFERAHHQALARA
jgi:hypothetical protein